MRTVQATRAAFVASRRRQCDRCGQAITRKPCACPAPRVRRSAADRIFK
jgi:hypothetical protein